MAQGVERSETDALRYDAAAMTRIDAFLACESPATPCVVVDLEIVRAQYRSLRAMFPNFSIYYAVKANPAAAVIATLAALGANFATTLRRPSAKIA